MRKFKEKKSISIHLCLLLDQSYKEDCESDL